MRKGWIRLYLVVVSFLLTCRVAAAKPPQDPNYHFDRAEVMDQVILSVIEKYYDPARIDPQAMFESTVNYLQKRFAEMTVSEDEKRGRTVITLLDKRVEIQIDKLNSPWSLSRNVRKVFGFLWENLPGDEYDFKDIEYGAANALLSVLDPHSNALPPDIYENLRMDTSGEFGGLGIRITTDRRPPCSGNLTVVDVFDGTPAKRAGLRSGDQIIRIEDESTINITTAEAADRLRGKPGSKVRIKVRRSDGTTRVFDIGRETIAIESVQAEMLSGRVGYIVLDAFQGNSLIEFSRALNKLHDQDMKGLILDLRDNPGGLLDTAVDIANLFLDSGTIVATAGRHRHEQTVRNANPEGTEGRYPIVVLISGNSASAAEIIAGALRNHGRVLLIGQTTFGKGSVQMVRPLAAGGALKLTSAQYLIPGDISIQAMGVAPDVRFTPYTADRKKVRLGHNTERFSEADLSAHLDQLGTRSRKDRRGVVDATLFIPTREKNADQAKFERCYVEKKDRESFRSQYEKQFARRLLAGAKGTTALELLVEARKLITLENRDNERFLARALRRVGIDWAHGPVPAPTGADADTEDGQLDTGKPTPGAIAKAGIAGTVAPGKTFKIKVTVHNNSREPIYRLRAITRSDNFALNGHEFVFGKVMPGKSRSWSAGVELSPVSTARVDPLTVEFERQSGPLPPPVVIDVEVPAQNEPRLAYTWQFQDLGNHNGLFEAGEELIVYVAVKNVGTGATTDAAAELAAKPGVDVIGGRFSIGRLRPGQIAQGVFRLKIAQRFDMNSAALTFSVQDWFPAPGLTTRPLLGREIDLPVSAVNPSAETASGSLTAAGKPSTRLWESPSKDSRVVATAPSGAGFEVDRVQAGFFRVVLGKDRRAWIQAADTIPGGRTAPQYSLLFMEPPDIAVDGPLTRRVLTDSAEVSGHVSHPERVRDIMVFVGDRKVVYQPNRNPDSKARIDFKVAVPLEVGANFVTLIARYDDNLAASIPIFIRRDRN